MFQVSFSKKKTTRANWHRSQTETAPPHNPTRSHMFEMLLSSTRKCFKDVWRPASALSARCTVDGGNSALTWFPNRSRKSPVHGPTSSQRHGAKVPKPLVVFVGGGAADGRHANGCERSQWGCWSVTGFAGTRTFPSGLVVVAPQCVCSVAALGLYWPVDSREVPDFATPGSPSVKFTDEKEKKTHPWWTFSTVVLWPPFPISVVSYVSVLCAFKCWRCQNSSAWVLLHLGVCGSRE